MKMRKLLALVLCLCLILPLCSAAFATGNEGEQNTDPTATPVADAENPPVETPVPPAVDDPEPDACTCGAEEGAAHAADCPLNNAPGAASPSPAADPAEPTPAAEIDTAAIVERLLAAATLEELAESVEALTDAEIAALSEEQIAAIEARFVALEPAPLPPVVIDETADAPVESEIFYPSRNYSNAAPFRDPVSGPAKMRLMAARAATAENSGMEIDKQAVTNADGSYTITLEAYATGAKVITEVTEEIPTDIVLVLDQSGSMDDPIGTVSFKQYEDEAGWLGTTYHTRNQDYYECRHNGGSANLWHKLGDDSFVSVSVTKQEQMEYTELGNLKNYETKWGSLTENCYYYYSNNLYEKIGDVYSKVDLVRSGNWRDGYVYTYTFSDGTTVTSNGNKAQPNFGSRAPLYAGTTETVYIYTYTDANNNVQTIGTSTGATTVPDFTLYERVVNANAGGSRLNALKSAVTSFAKAVEEKAKGEDGNFGTEDDVNHRIAVVGFASSGNQYNNNPYENTEVFVGDKQYTYGSSASGQYGNALQSMNTEAGQNSIADSINALDAYGGTFTNLGMEMANGILNANPVQSGTKRNRVVIVFTDGVPGGEGYDRNVANAAISQASTAKTNGVTVYTVGIFSGADATSAGNQNGTEDQKANWFMQQVSSNNGTPRNPSYYLSAADAGTLKNIFQKISDQIETGGSSTTLSEETVIKDIIAPAFTLPEGASASNITLETYQCTGKNGDAYTWSESKNADAMGATATVNGDTVSVTGFDFAKNYVGTVTENGNVTYRGHKLVIKFTVTPKDGFLGGNGVYTNASAGVYENGSATDPVLTFDRPTVNVPIPAVTVTAQDKAVYLLNGLTADTLRSGAVVKVGDVPLDLTKADQNFGLKAWQTEYVDITVAIQDKDGKVITSDLSDLTEDQTYTISVTVTPKPVPADVTPSGEAATEQTNSGNAKISVYKPELTAADSTIYLGQTADYADNFNPATGIKWKHGDTVADPAKMGEAPVLTVGYKPAAGAFTQDTDVKMTTAIGGSDVTQHTMFINTTDDQTDDHDNNGADAHQFTVFVKTCSLTVTKTGSGSMTNGTETHIFTVEGPNGISLKVAVQGNGSRTITGLPVGDYTVTEDTDWSWRYEDGKTGEATLSSTAPDGEVKISNTDLKTKWLSGDSAAINKFAAPPASSAAVQSAPALQADAPAGLPEGPVELNIKE